MPTNLRHLSLRIDEGLLRRLEYVAAYEDRSMNSTLLQLVRRFVADFEEKHGPIDLEDKMKSS